MYDITIHITTVFVWEQRRNQSKMATSVWIKYHNAYKVQKALIQLLLFTNKLNSEFQIITFAKLVGIEWITAAVNA
jgi:hypothetical protein